MSNLASALPTGWKLFSVKDAFAIRNNLRKPISQEEREKVKGEYPYYGPTKAQGYISSYEQDGKFALIGEDGDHFLKYQNISMTQLISGKCTVNNHAHVVEGTNICIAEWFYYFFMHKELTSFLTRQGAGRFKLNKAALEKIPVLVPPVAEQTKIAQILSTWDKAIAITERLLANSQQQKQALMQQLLTGQKRFAGFSGSWDTQKLSEISTRIQRKSDGEEHPILTISSLSGFVTQEDKYSRYMAGESVNNYIQLNQGEFAYNKGNSKTYQYGCIFKLDTFDTGLVPHVYVCFKLNQGFDPEYYAQLFAADYLKDQLAGLVNTGVRNNGLLNIKPSAFLDTTVPVPPLPEQQKIAQVLSTADAEISNLQAQLAKLKLEKKALMQQLLTGQRRVKLDDELEASIRRVG